MKYSNQKSLFFGFKEVFLLTTLLTAMLSISVAHATGCADEGICINNVDGFGERLPLIGGNMTYASNGQGIAELVDGDVQFNEAMLEAFEIYSPEWIRFPGGGISHTYDFTRSIGPVETRRPQLHPFKNRMDAELSLWGPDEAAQFAENVGGELVIVIPWDRGAGLAEKFVAYMNGDVTDPQYRTYAASASNVDWARQRMANGRTEPYNIKYWEIGNEPSGDEPTWANWPDDGDDYIGYWNNPSKSQNEQFSQYYNYGGTRTFTNQKAVRRTDWNDEAIMTTNAKNQLFLTKFGKVDDKQPLRVVVADSDGSNAQEWQVVENFKQSGPNDRHVRLANKFAGRLVFGDGVAGAIPPAGKFVFVDYTSGPHDGFVDIYNAMKKADPSIHIASAHFSSLKDRSNVPFPDFEGIQTHGGSFFGNAPLSNDDVLEECVSRGAITMPNILSSQEKQLAKFEAQDVKIYMTEFSMFGNLTNVGDQKQNVYQDTICGALIHSLSAIGIFEAGNVAMFGPNYLANERSNQAIIESDGALTVPALFYNMLNENYGTHHLESSYEGSMQRQELNGLLKSNKGVAVEKVPQLIYSASYKPNNGRTYVMVVNTSDEVVTETLNFRDAVLPRFKVSLSEEDFLDGLDNSENISSAKNYQRLSRTTKKDNHTYKFEPYSVNILVFDGKKVLSTIDSESTLQSYLSAFMNQLLMLRTMVKES